MTVPYIIGAVINLGLILLLIRELRRSPGPLRWGKRPVWKKRVRISFVVLLLIMAGLGSWAFLIEPNRLIVNQQSIQIENWPPQLSSLRIAMIADIHTDNLFIDERKLQRIVELTNAQNPDLILLLGDFMKGGRNNPDRVEPEVTAAALKGLKAPLGVYCVLGNHDWWYNGLKVRRALEQNGFHVLEDEAVELNWHNQSFWLVGLADLWTRPQHIDETVARVPAGSTIIAITHNPDIFPDLPQSVPLLLAAHTHGGQVNFPIFGTPIVPSQFGRKYTSGQIVENGHQMYVTTGIGTSIIPVRFRVPPEIVILQVSRK
jgi:uncharacterized protein